MEESRTLTPPEVRILLVEDSASDRKIFRRFLQSQQRYRFDFLEADTVEAGLELCRREAVDCVILDFKLPGRDGLRSLPDFTACSAPVIFVTGHAQPLTVTEAYRQGASACLSKDTLTSTALQQAVMEALNLS